jgi:hypothetical protein
MTKKVSDAFSVPINVTYKSREMRQGLRDQLLPDKVSDIFSRVFTSIDSRPIVDTSQTHLGVVVRTITGKEPPVGSVPWVRNQESGNAISQSEISNICFVASYDRVNLFNKLPERIKSNLKKDLALERNLILCYEEGSIPSMTIKEGSVVQIEFVNWPIEARIIAVQEKNTPFPADSEGIQNAFIGADGGTLGDLLPISRAEAGVYARGRGNPCRLANEVVEVADQIGIPPAVLAAFRQIESRGNPAALRFEPHKFNANKQVNEKVPCTIEKGKSASYVASETNQSAFERAYKINPKAAIDSTSFGLYQVVIQYAPEIWNDPTINNDPEKFLKAFKQNPNEFSKTLVKAWFKGNKEAIKAANQNPPNFDKIARLYNGPGYKSQNYDVLLKNALQESSKCKEYNGQEPPASLYGVRGFVQETADQQQLLQEQAEAANRSVIAVTPPEER